MNREQETKLFEATKELPTELSLKEVQQIFGDIRQKVHVRN